MPENDKRLFLLDAMALIYRAFYALNKNPRKNSKGLNTSAILGFANTLYDLLKTEKPSHIGVAFDTMAPTVRHDDFAAYKANRQAMPEDLSIAIPYIKQLIHAFNIPILYVDGYEADDVIGTLAKEAERQGFTTYMMTPDKDFGQLVSDSIFIYKPGKFGEKASIHTSKDVCEKFGIKRPEQVQDFLGLAGDASDNIPGIPGVGPVAAKRLIEEFDTVENIVLHAAEIKNEAVRLKVQQFGEQAIFSKQLATIILDVPIAFEEKNLKMGLPNIEELKKLLDELEFRAFAKRVFTDLSLTSPETILSSPNAQPDLFSFVENKANINEIQSSKANIYNTPHQYHLVDSPEKRAELIAKLQNLESFCFDTETTGLDTSTAELVGISFAFVSHEAWFIRLPDNYKEAYSIVQEFKPVFENSGIGKTGQNIKFDIAMLHRYDINVRGNLFDTMIAHYLLQPDMRHNMDYLAETYLNYAPVSIETLIGKKGKNQLSMRLVDAENIKEYAAEDADITFQIKTIFEPLLTETDTRKLFDEIEMPLIPVLASMESEGVQLDIDTLSEYSEQLKKEISTLDSDIQQLAGTNFNIASPKQLGEVLYDWLQLAGKPKLTKTKQYATGEEVLVKLINKHPIVPKILEYRELSKLKSTYVDALPALANPATGRLHTSYNQAVASTGRLSSNNPNLQNIPIRTERGREIRKAFIARNENYILLSADYSQIELRIIASLSQDEGMMEAFRQGLDIHAATAAKVFDVKLKDVTKEMRRRAKTVNFGIVYGISSFGLSEQLSISRNEAAEIIKQYFDKYPGIRQYMEQTIAFARANGYVETIMKRRRYLPEITSGNANIRGFAERNAINAPIQGSSADMIKIAMINIYNDLNERNLKTRMILQVHDELVFDVYKEELEIVKPIISNRMKNAIPLLIPVDVEMNTGTNWLEAH